MCYVYSLTSRESRGCILDFEQECNGSLKCGIQATKGRHTSQILRENMVKLITRQPELYIKTAQLENNRFYHNFHISIKHCISYKT